ncbi:glycosyltransferase family 4 protein [Arthrobacter sp. CAN_A1]|uniref:glycosyltransferase family 4 protein n=1 Tax=Arthrobacter sp. CAN_A1 TaxID=2787717 RepID=UPI0018CB5862
MQARDAGLTVLVAHPSGDLYGSDKMLLESVIGMRDEGFSVVVTLPTAGPLINELAAHGVSVLLCPTLVLRKSLLSPYGALTLVKDALSGLVKGLRLMRDHRPDVIYVSTITLPLWFLVARVSRRPTVAHVHEAEGSASRLLRTLLAAPLLAAKSILVNSQYSATVQERAIPRLKGRMNIVYNGVAGPPDAVLPREELKDGMRLLYVGRLSHRKGVDVAVGAVAELRRRGVDASLDIVGAVFPGNEAFLTGLEAQVAEHGLGRVVTFHGYQSSIWPFLDRADICLVPSRFDEPFGNTAVESLLAARPLIVSDTSGLREAADGYRSSRFVAPDSVDELADAVQDIHGAWHDYREWAVIDAKLARDKHSINTYRQAVAQAVSGAAGARR